MDVQGLKDKILQLAIHGKLVEQDKNDEPASALVQRIKEERDKLVREGKIRKPKKLAPIEEEEKPFEIPGSWEWVRLGEVSKIISKGTTPKGGRNAYKDKGIYFLRVENLTRDYNIDLSNVKLVDIGVHESQLRRSIGEENDLLISIAGTLGRVAILKKEHLPCNMNQAICFVRVFYEKVNVDYLKYIISSLNIQKSMISKTKTTAQPNLTLEIITDLIIPLPPFAEQKRIVEKVDELFALIDELDSNKEDLLEVINLTRNQVLREAIQGKLVEQNPEDEPASVLLDRIKEEREKLIKEGKIRKEKPLPEIKEEEKPFEIPEGWEWVRFGNLVEFKIGKTPKRSNLGYWDNGTYPWFSISDIKEGETIYDSKEKISEKAYTDIFKGQISPKDTLIMSFKLSIGKMSILGVDGFHNEAIISIFPIYDSEEITKMYLFKIMDGLDILGDSKSAVKGATLNTTSLNNILIPLPPLAEQKRIVEKVDMIIEMLDKLENELTTKI